MTPFVQVPRLVQDRVKLWMQVVRLVFGSFASALTCPTLSTLGILYFVFCIFIWKICICISIPNHQYTWEQQKSFDEDRVLSFLPLKMRTDLALQVESET